MKGIWTCQAVEQLCRMLIPQQGLGATFAVLTDIDMVEQRIIWGGVGMKILSSGILEHIMEVHTTKEIPPPYFSDGSFQLSVFVPALFPQQMPHPFYKLSCAIIFVCLNIFGPHSFLFQGPAYVCHPLSLGTIISFPYEFIRGLFAIMPIFSLCILSLLGIFLTCFCKVSYTPSCFSG